MVAVNNIETRDRASFVPQRPHQAPWVVICLLAASTSFLAGHIYANSDNKPDRPPQLTSIAPQVTGVVGKAFGNSDNPVADIVASVGPSVVSIDTTIHSKHRRSQFSLPDLFNKQEDAIPDKDEAHGSGSGVIFREDGYILTNNHVVRGADEIKVTMNDGKTFLGNVIGRDSYSDVAVIKIDGGKLPVAKLGNSKEIRPGDWAIAIGSPLGLNHSVTMGIVSAVGRSLADLNNNIDLIQTDAAINPGNSGGPLLNIRGEVIGINMAIRTDAQNIGFTIPIDVAKDAAGAIFAHKPLSRPYLGISMIDFDADLAKTVGMPTWMQGVLVSKVVEHSPAADSGISEGDLIEFVNETPVRTGHDVQKIVRTQKIGTEVHMKVYHGGKSKSVNVKLTNFPTDEGRG